MHSVPPFPPPEITKQYWDKGNSADKTKKEGKRKRVNREDVQQVKIIQYDQTLTGELFSTKFCKKNNDFVN